MNDVDKKEEEGQCMIKMRERKRERERGREKINREERRGEREERRKEKEGTIIIGISTINVCRLMRCLKSRTPPEEK